MSIREAIFSKQDIPSQQVEIPEWDITLEVRGMTGADRTRMMALAVNAETGESDLMAIYPEVVIACTFDPETGERVFDDGDSAAILSKSAQAVDRLAAVGMELSGLTKQAQDRQAAAFPDESE